MKTSLRLLPFIASLFLPVLTASALTVPVAEDTFSTTTAGVQSIKAKSGSAMALPVNSKQTAFIRFDLNDLDVIPASIQAGNIKSAILRIYVASAKHGADLTVHSVTSSWGELLNAPSMPLPTINPIPIATISAAQVSRAKIFATVDVTAAVVAAIQGGDVNGFAIQTNSDTANILLGSKEGAATGYPAELDIEANLAENGSGNMTAQNLVLPATTATTGIVYSGANTLLHTYGTSNLFVGTNAGNLAMSGLGNTGVGENALISNTTGTLNAAVGSEALRSNTSGKYNTAEGNGSLRANTTGSFNSAHGFESLFSNTVGVQNTGIGYSSLLNNTTGSCNTASGCTALDSNTTGSYNTATGMDALFTNSTGTGNTAIGYYSAYNTTSGNNTAVGSNALDNNTTGGYNIALGSEAGSNLTTGNLNIAIGNPGVAGESGVIRIGGVLTQNAAYIAGISGATASGGAAVYVNASGKLGTITSSRRFKTDIQDMGDASSVLLSFAPVTFRYKPEIDPAGLPQFGLIAEDVEKLNPSLVIYDDKGQVQTVRYEAVNAMLLNEFLKEHKRVQALEEQVNALAARLSELEKKLP